MMTLLPQHPSRAMMKVGKSCILGRRNVRAFTGGHAVPTVLTDVLRKSEKRSDSWQFAQLHSLGALLVSVGLTLT